MTGIAPQNNNSQWRINRWRESRVYLKIGANLRRQRGTIGSEINVPAGLSELGDRLSLAMDPKTAANFLVDQGTALITQRNPDAFLSLLSQGEPPYPGQMTSILLALKTAYDAHRDAKQIDRFLAHALHLLAMESHQLYEAGRRNGVQWPPLLAEDLQRLELAVQSIFSGEWQG
ncbi:MAG: hypothetical protein WBB29_18910 [Geitlerinemataceae cyanobacterium]